MEKETKQKIDEWIDNYISAKRGILMMLDGFIEKYSDICIDGDVYTALPDIVSVNEPLNKVHIYEGLDKLAEILGAEIKVEEMLDEIYVKHSFVYRNILFYELMRKMQDESSN